MRFMTFMVRALGTPAAVGIAVSERGTRNSGRAFTMEALRQPAPVRKGADCGAAIPRFLWRGLTLTTIASVRTRLEARQIKVLQKKPCRHQPEPAEHEYHHGNLKHEPQDDDHDEK